ncbi:hypothetical protein [Chitinophaga pinensis]|uniref:Uncharacterized protein n=1 Tax=Chitinophaga pinensis (strain ATCC 43595 / DSM 2588 / LMG 13176 / NBRC 15968 / NCIMB 11800 / UQM 2034) TaxID=485918 RepID=A0A979G7T0_CHIPD|nr:hypothetical protein [Chitinophaga pinensis]ACU62323.1 hypothetical protein Cpin_4889 [Chitinophaga pinensis DSM 2588]
MRRLILPCAILFPVLLGSSAAAQSILTIRETDQNNKTYDNKNNADINSRLNIRFDRAAFIRKVNTAGIGSPLPEDAVSLLNVLYEGTRKVDIWAKGMEEAVRQHVRGDKNSLPAFLEKTASIAQEITTVFDRDPATRDYFEAYDDVTDIWGGITYALNRRIADLEKQLTDGGAYNDVRVQIGGWLMHNNQPSPLHFNGLDDNPQGEYYEVQRWKFTLSDAQLSQLEDIQKWVKSSQQREMNVNEILRGEYIRQFTDILQQRLKTDYEDFRKEGEKVLSTLQDEQIITDVQQALAQGELIKSLLNEKVKYYQSIDNTSKFELSGFMSRLQSDVTSLNSEFTKMKGLLTAIKTDIPAASAAVQTQCASLLSLASGKLTALADMVIPDDILQFGKEERKLAELALRFSDKVFSLALGNIPSEAATDLLYSGYRESGDRVVIKMQVTNGSSRRNLMEETHSLTLYRILAHIEATVGVIFAHPLKTTKIEKDVQMAPYYNVLFKGIFGMSQKWKRNSSLPNNLLDLNFGLHVSSPDFDKDDVPELGLGIVASTLHDYLQVGWAYNLFYGAHYVFVGFRLPIPTMSLGGNNAGAK